MTRQGLMLTEEFAVAVVAAPANKFAPFHSIVDYPSYKKKFRQIELGRVGRPSSWIESSPASSPTQIKASAAAAAAAAAAALTAYRGGGDYERWLELHPSALGNFEELMVASKGKQIVMFLDYDGTLSPIVDDPDCAFMSDEMREAVRDVASHFPTAIVSGRCREKVSNFVRLSELYYAGSHGMDIEGPMAPIHGHKHTKTKAKSVLFQPANEFLPMIDEVYKKLVETTKGVPGSRVENNKFCLSVHFRCVEEKKWNLLSDKVRSLLKGYPKLRITHGRKVMEIRPTIKWDKGKALEFLLESLGLSNRNDVLPLYVGDDRTDEDAFKVLRNRGQGFGILVSKIAKETNAAFSLREPAEVQTFLRRLAELPRGWCIGKVV